MDRNPRWERFRKHLHQYPEIGLMLDISAMNFPDGFLEAMEPRLVRVYGEMAELEGGAAANPTEGRMVGHYWLRAPYLAPGDELGDKISRVVTDIKSFSHGIHSGAITSGRGDRFSRLLVIGIGGSSLGPQLVADALGGPGNALRPCFLDNTDPDGIDRVLADLGDDLARTLILVISKSGGTSETRNGMLEVRRACDSAGIDFARQAVAVTGEGSALDQAAEREGWLARFPMWDWVGGRTSVTSAVGLLPAALQGIDIDGFLEGARQCDAITRIPNNRTNPAALLALMWYHATGGKGSRDMVVLPYKDRLVLFSRYLQQLVMESLGKGSDRSGREVNQGLAVYGNKGSTDQHALVQQLRDGLNNFFVTFIEVLKDREGTSLQVEPGITSGDYLNSFIHGTREALAQKGRESLTITLDRLDARSLGAMIALFERTVGFYASLVDINAYDQPGVEAGKKAAASVLDLQSRVIATLRSFGGTAMTAEEVAKALQAPESAETVFRVLLHCAANDDHGIIMERKKNVTASRFRCA